MTMSTLYLLCLAVYAISSSASSEFLTTGSTSNETYKCPVWLGSCNSDMCYEVSTSNPAIKCSGHPQWFVLHCYCITYYHKNSSLPVTGLCPYTCSTKLLKNGTKLPVDKNITEITQEECNPLYREGQLCGKCMQNYAPAAYSYTNDCVNCTEYKWNWLKYVAVAYGPQTFFFVAIVLTKTSVTSGWMVGYVTVSQLIATSVESRFRTSESNEENLLIKYVFPVVYGVWNLDFFKDIYTPFCVHPGQTILAAIAMDYTVALYPIVLLVLTYTALELFNRYTETRSCWRPIYKLRQSYRKYCDFRGSAIDGFATVLILSYVKILNTSTELLLLTPVVNLKGKVIEMVAYYNGSMTYFGRDHLPYAVLSITMLIVFNIIPLLLITLYPYQCFQSFLNKHVATKVKVNFIHLVMDMFYRSYKLKQRRFAVVYIYIRLSTFVILLLILNPISISLLSVLYFCSAAVLGLAQPHQKMSHNIVNCFFLVFIGVIKAVEFIVYTAFSVYPHELKHKGGLIISSLYSVLPIVFILSVISGCLPSNFFRKLSITAQAVSFKFRKRHYHEAIIQTNNSYSNDDIDEYTKLIDVNM